jgi:exonuclease SbcD
MRILHTGDWHLGRYLHGVSLLEDQSHALDQFVDLAKHLAVDTIVIAGDVYDRSVPPADAVALLDDVLARLVVGAGIPVILIAGNHDSPERIGFGGRILGRQGLHLRGTLEDCSPVLLADDHGTVAFHPLPYAEPVFARALPGGEHVASHQDAMTLLVSSMRAGLAAGARNVLVGHAFVSGGSESESERPLSVGGSGMVAAETFDGFDFVALGHLHRPQSLDKGRIHYPGSLLKYSFNEVDHVKGVSLVEIEGDRTVSVQSFVLKALRDVRTISGTLDELLRAPDEAVGNRQDYLCAILTDPAPVLEPMARLREVYPNMLELRFERSVAAAAGGRAQGDHRRHQPTDLFRAFYRDVVGDELTEDATGIFNASAQAAMADREGSAQ